MVAGLFILDVIVICPFAVETFIENDSDAKPTVSYSIFPLLDFSGYAVPSVRIWTPSRSTELHQTPMRLVSNAVTPPSPTGLVLSFLQPAIIATATVTMTRNLHRLRLVLVCIVLSSQIVGGVIKLSVSNIVRTGLLTIMTFLQARPISVHSRMPLSEADYSLHLSNTF